MQQPKADFPPSARLLSPAGYRRVFQNARRSADRYFTVLYLDNGTSEARLGMAVAKKVLNRAVDRNLVKRLIRESFRQHRAGLTGWDLVVLCRKGLPTAERQKLSASLDRHWHRIQSARDDL